jgi:flagellar biogenesis protein FliO
LAESTNATGPSDALAGTLMLIGQLLLVIVAVLVALAWIWFPFMVKGRLDKIIRKLDNLEQLQGKLCAAPPIRS